MSRSDRLFVLLLPFLLTTIFLTFAVARPYFIQRAEQEREHSMRERGCRVEIRDWRGLPTWHCPADDPDASVPVDTVQTHRRPK